MIYVYILILIIILLLILNKIDIKYKISLLVFLFIILSILHILKFEFIISEKYTKLEKRYNFFLKKYDKEKIKNRKFNFPIFYINLKKSKHRNNFMQTQLDRYNLKATRIDAINGNKIKVGDKIDIGFNNYFYFTKDIIYNITLLELSCTFSHIKAINTAYNLDKDTAIILEDDASFMLYPFWPIKLEDVITNAPSDWNVIVLSNQNCNDIINYEYKKFDPNDRCDGAVAYIINKKGMKNVLNSIHSKNKILDNFSNIPYMVADSFIYAKAKNTYFFTFPLILPYNDYRLQNSTIHPSHTSNHIINSLKVTDKYISDDLQLKF